MAAIVYLNITTEKGELMERVAVSANLMREADRNLTPVQLAHDILDRIENRYNVEEL